MATSLVRPRRASLVKCIGAVVLALVLHPGAASAQEAPEQGVHEVRNGDTLWDLSRQYLQDPFRWPDIFRLNEDVVENPHLIYPRERLRIPGLEGRQADASNGNGGEVDETPAARTVFYTPEVPRSQRTFIGSVEVANAAVTPGEFYSAGMLVDESQVRTIGRVEEVVSPTVVPVGIPHQVSLYDKAYAVVAEGSVREGDRVHLVRPGRRIEAVGRVYEPTGLARVLSVEAGTATIEVDELFDVVEIGNLVLPLPDYGVPTGAVARETGGLEGQLIAFERSQAVYSVQDVAFLNLGRQVGVVEGDEFEVVIPGEQRDWGQRPEVVVGRLRVVRVMGDTSAAQVIEVEHPALEPGLVVRLVAKMPPM